jgi:hypothetical protein
LSYDFISPYLGSDTGHDPPIVEQGIPNGPL